MRILFGVPDQMHRELADLEIEGLRNKLINCDTIHYGPNSKKNKYIKKIANLLSNAIQIKKSLKTNQYDLLFLNTAFDRNAIVRDTFTLLITRSYKTKVFLKFHGSDLLLLGKLNWLEKKIVSWLFQITDGVGVLSKEERFAFINEGYPKNKIFVVKNPINPLLYSKDINFKTGIGISNETFLFMFCGRFIKQKGLIDVLNAFLEIQNNKKSSHLICIGDGMEMEDARLFVQEHKLKNQVTFTGFIPEIEIRRFYSNVDALVFPTYHQEGFPMVVFQSLAAGLPIITTRIRAAADYLSDPDNCLWAESKNVESIANAMVTLLTDTDIRVKMSINNKLLSQQFTTNNNAIEYKHIFEELTQH